MSVPRSADAVVVGGGAIGASAAFHLRRLGVRDVVLLERDSLASGSTSKSAGGIRTQFADELNVRIALRSLEEFERFEELTGTDIALRQHGYLFLLDTEETVAEFREALALQHSLGVPSRELTPAEAAEIVPQLSLDGLLAGTFCARCDLSPFVPTHRVVSSTGLGPYGDLGSDYKRRLLELEGVRI